MKKRILAGLLAVMLLLSLLPVWAVAEPMLLSTGKTYTVWNQPVEL